LGRSRLGQAGTATGATLTPGSIDSDWTIPPPVMLDDGNVVRLFKDGQAMRAAFEAIRAAKRLICLEVYIFHSDDVGRAFAELLCAKARQGLRVYVLYDSFGSIDTGQSMFDAMRSAGVRLEQFHPILPWNCTYSWRPVNRDHRKLLIIDHHLAGLGGLNIGLEYGSGLLNRTKQKFEIWRDNAISISGPAARDLFHCFAQTWRYVTRGGKFSRAEFIYNLDVGRRQRHPRMRRRKRRRKVAGRGVLVYSGADGPEDPSVLPAQPVGPDQDFGILASVPTLSSPLLPFLQKLIRDARGSVHMTIAYFAPSDPFIAELCKAARRGVRVRLMLPGRSDVKLLRIAARSFYETLLDAGVEIYERQGAVLHAKTLVIDQRLSVVGSTNLDYRSIEYNCEISLVVRSAELGRQMVELFDHDVQFAEQMALQAWRHRPAWDRAVQWAVSRARYWL
jgi:cardiolipin synthase